MILDINGPNAKKLRDFALSNFPDTRLYTDWKWKWIRVIDKYPGCHFSFGNGSNLMHKKEPYWYTYKFDAEFLISCGKQKGKMKCELEIRDLIEGGFVYRSHTSPKCNRFPRIAISK